MPPDTFSSRQFVAVQVDLGQYAEHRGRHHCPGLRAVVLPVRSFAFLGRVTVATCSGSCFLWDMGRSEEVVGDELRGQHLAQRSVECVGDHPADAVDSGPTRRSAPRARGCARG